MMWEIPFIRPTLLCQRVCVRLYACPSLCACASLGVYVCTCCALRRAGTAPVRVSSSPPAAVIFPFCKGTVGHGRIILVHVNKRRFEQQFSLITHSSQ